MVYVCSIFTEICHAGDFIEKIQHIHFLHASEAFPDGLMKSANFKGVVQGLVKVASDSVRITSMECIQCIHVTNEEFAANYIHI